MCLTPDLQDGLGLGRGQLHGQVEDLLTPRRKVAHSFLGRGGEEGEGEKRGKWRAIVGGRTGTQKG